MCLRELSAPGELGVKVARLSTRIAGTGLTVASELADLAIDELGPGVWCCSPTERGRRTTRRARSAAHGGVSHAPCSPAGGGGAWRQERAVEGHERARVLSSGEGPANDSGGQPSA